MNFENSIKNFKIFIRCGFCKVSVSTSRNYGLQEKLIADSDSARRALHYLDFYLVNWRFDLNRDFKYEKSYDPTSRKEKNQL